MGFLTLTDTMPTVDASTYAETVKSMLSGIFTLDNLQTILITALGLCAGFFIFWFAYRFIKRKVEKAMKKGSI